MAFVGVPVGGACLHRKGAIGGEHAGGCVYGSRIALS